MDFKQNLSTIILIVGIIAVAIYFALRNKKSTTTDTSEKTVVSAEEKALSQAGALYNSQVGDAQTAVKQSAEDEEYNLMRQEYIKVVGQTPSKTLTYDQLKKGIDDYNEKAALLKTYVNITNDSDTSQEAAMSISELERAISVAKTDKKSTWTKRKATIDGYVSSAALFFATNRDKSQLTDLEGVDSLTSDVDKSYFIKQFSKANRTVYKSLTAKTTTNSFITACNTYEGGLKKTQKNTKICLDGLKQKYSDVTARNIDEYGNFA